MWPWRRRRQIKLLQQDTSSDCAYACLAMILDGFGTQASVEVLKSRMPTSASGTSLPQLLELAATFRLSGSAFKAEPEALSSLSFPVILHWDMNHFVVLASVSRGRYEILDPARGRLFLRTSAVSDHFTGIALRFQRMPDYRQTRQVIRSSISDLWERATGTKRSVFAIIVLGLISQLFIVLTPLIYASMIDVASFDAKKVLLLLVVAAVVSNLLVVGGDLARRKYVVELGSSVSQQATSNVINHLLRLPFAFFQQRRIGDVTSRVESTRFLRDALTDGALSAVLDGAFSAIALAILFLACPWAAAIIIVSSGLYALFRVVVHRRFRTLEARTFHAQAVEQGISSECLRAHVSIKALGMEAARASAWSAANAESLNRTRDIQTFAGVMAAGRSAFSSVELVTVTGLGVWMVQAGSIGLGTLFAVLALRQIVQDRIYPLIEKIFDFDILRARMQRLRDITWQEQDAQHSATPEPIDIPSGSIIIAGLSFRYEQAGPPIVDDLSMVIRAQEFIAIKGLSGAGKSTFIKLVAGLLVPERGSIHVDGSLLTPGNMAAYKRALGIVMQDDTLFSGTILDNITAFDPETDFERAANAARLADIEIDIEHMRMGYFALIGDMGSALSGGQRQRLLLARALYRRPRILILDEGTANLDPERELKVISNLRKMGTTVISVAHRSRTLEMADRIFEFAGGKLVESSSMGVHPGPTGEPPEVDALVESNA